jgi:polyhydroxyalkanoate synthase
VVPSLINRAHILDLLPECSLLAHLAGERFRPFLLDWGEPGPLERRMTLEQHITDRLGAGAAWLTAESGAAPVVIGYCMGGTLALGFAAAMRPRISGLALLATPFDFHAAGLDGPGYQALVAGPSALLAGAWGGLPVDLIQALFAGIDPLEVPRKFARFARLDPAGLEARRFVAVEDWLNDGVPLGAEVADACLSGWYGENRPASGRWRIDGRVVRAEEVRVPTFLAVPTRDRIVPPASAQALAGRLGSRPTVVRPAGGHIGMVVGVRGTSSLWSPLVAWLREVAALQKGAC